MGTREQDDATRTTGGELLIRRQLRQLTTLTAQRRAHGTERAPLGTTGLQVTAIASDCESHKP